jgi:hypothetical protein
MVLAATREGLLRAWAVRRLVLAVWLIHLVLAAAAAFPFWRILRSVTGPLPETDPLRASIAYGILADLAEIRPGLTGSVALVSLVVLGLGLLVGAAVSAGVLEVLRGGGPGSLGQRFGTGAGCFYGRFVRLTLAVGALFGVLGALALAPPLLLARAHLRDGTGPGWPGPAGAVAIMVVILVSASLVLDASRIHVVRGAGGAWRALRAGVRTVSRRPLSWLGVWLANAAILGGALGLYLLARQAISPESEALIVIIVVAQQAFVLARTGLRVAHLASEWSLVEGREPRSLPSVAAPGAPQSEPTSPPPSVV